jgi:intermediate cleaving peptidase 55
MSVNVATDSSYPFHQDPNFFYLTGFVERNALAVIRKFTLKTDFNIIGKDPSSQRGYTYHLFVLPSDPDKAKWDGLPIGVEGAMKSYHADQATSNTRISSELPSLLSDAKHIYISFPTSLGSISEEIRPRSRFLTNVSRYLPFLTLDDRFQPLASTLHELRSVKSPAEIACMREAGRISGGAFNEVIRLGQSKEKDIEATLEWLFRIGGCERSAYVPVVAGGKVLTSVS